MKAAQPARGLFKAMGKRAKLHPVLFDDGSVGEAEQRPRQEFDFEPTPPEPTLAIMHAEGDRIRQIGGPIWEMAAGDGRMARDIASCGFDVISSDLIDRGHPGCTIKGFYDYSAPPPGVRIGLTNPPYSEVNWRDGKGRWVRHALEECKLPYLALLLSWNWPSAGGLAKVWEEHPPARVYLMRWKIDFSGMGSPPMLNAWFIWDRETFTGETVLRMLDRVDPRQTSLLGETP